MLTSGGGSANNTENVDMTGFTVRLASMEAAWSSYCHGGQLDVNMSSNSNIVVEWLRSLHLGQYAESFIDNGYDDLEICKQVGDPDLDAIGVFNPAHRSRLLHSVRTLREEGAASVYFTLEETAALHDECQCDSSSARSSRTSSDHQGSSDKDNHIGQRCGTGNSPASSSAESAQELGKYLDEYEEGKAELVKIPRIQLKLLVKEKLAQDGIRLSCQPYSTSAELTPLWKMWKEIENHPQHTTEIRTSAPLLSITMKLNVSLTSQTTRPPPRAREHSILDCFCW
uniref:Sterile alpha motif domain-containing protein 5 n=1 Tax=Timema douglasi TaxID=61478 RepID=A0A7R8Z9H7_TIMDO|nr:unnamed protein product [Timema douglasi]